MERAKLWLDREKFPRHDCWSDLEMTRISGEPEAGPELNWNPQPRMLHRKRKEMKALSGRSGVGDLGPVDLGTLALGITCFRSFQLFYTVST